MTSILRRLRIATLVSVIGLSLLASGCGGNSSSSDDSGTTKAAVKEATPEPSSEFLDDSNRSIVKFGTEASLKEREAAGAVLAENLKAREAADFKTRCDTLTAKAIEEIPGATEPGGLKDNCAVALKELATPLLHSAKIRKDTLSGPIAALRVKGDAAYALYHGNDGKDYGMSLKKEDGTWKVGAIETIEL